MQTHPIIVEIDEIYVQNIPLFRNVATWQLEKCADTGGTDADTMQTLLSRIARLLNNLNEDVPNWIHGQAADELFMHT